MEVWEAENFLFKRRAGTPAPHLLRDVKELKGKGELKYPANSSDANTGVDVNDKPPYPVGKYMWTTHSQGPIPSGPDVSPVIGDGSDGINARDVIAERPDFCQQAWQLVLDLGFLVFKGMSQSGKTSALQLLGKYAMSKGMSVSYFKATSLLHKETLESGLRRRCDIDLNELFSRPFEGAVHLLMIDECQKLFRRHDKYKAARLWEIMQDVSNPAPYGKSSSLRVVLALKYGSDPSGLSPGQWDIQSNTSGLAMPSRSSEPQSVSSDEDDEDVVMQESTLVSDSSLDSVPTESPLVWGVKRTVEMQPMAKRFAPRIALRLSLTEYYKLLEDLRQRLQRPDLMTDQAQVDMVFGICNGLTGLIMALLDALREKLRNASPALSSTGVMWYILQSKDVFDTLYPLRSFLRNEKITQAHIQVIRDILQSNTGQIRVNLLPRDLKATAENMSRAGILQTFERNCVGFPSLLHGQYYVQVLCGLTDKPRFCWDQDASLVEFVKLTIASMSSKTLRSTCSKGKKGQVIERQYQMLWSSAAAYAMPMGADMFPDVGSVFDSTGALDFYMTFDGEDISQGWAFELLVGGDRALAHERRFRQNGLYHRIPYSQHCIVDFRQTGKHGRVTQPKQDFIHVTFEESFLRAHLQIADTDGGSVELAP